jgi:signal transduction histidine kinase
MTSLRAWWPRSLSGRLAWILFGGLLAAHLLSIGLLLVERGLVMRGMMVSYLASDVASSVAVLERVPAAERAAWLPRLARPNYRFTLPASFGPPATTAQDASTAQAITAALVPPRPVQAMEREDGSAQLRLQLADGTPVAVEVAAPRMRVSPWLIAVLALQLALLAAVGAWAVRTATRPLRSLSDAAEALDPAGRGEPLSLEGPVEVARAAGAFNRMQARIRSHVDERMRILAAVSHDLQTPITRLRLRADLVDDAGLREKMQADLAEMQGLVEEGISYARSAHAVREPEHAVDLAALLDSIACDYADAGKPVRLLASPAGTWRTRPQALRRLVCNLVDNALKFAGAAEIEAAAAPRGGVAIRVLDRGPGIDPALLDAVMQPFYRIEDSRSRTSGGTGLGLAIAQQLALALGGRLSLAGREGGGLEARLELPEQPA